MAKYESNIKVVKATAEHVFETLTDFSRLEGRIPAQYVKDFRAETDACYFTVDKIGQICVRIVEKKEFSLIKYGFEAAAPVNINLFVQLKPSPDTETDSRMKVTLVAEIPLLLRPMIGGKLQDAVDKIADVISRNMF